MKDVANLTGTIFRGWNLGNQIGAGGSAIVYSATQGSQTAAIKIFHPEALDKHGFSEERERLELQLQHKGNQHPNLVQIYDGSVAEELETLYIIMEMVPGRTLDKVLHELPRNAIAPLLQQLVDAAHFLEEKDLVHRDIKPANIMIDAGLSHLTLLDLGIVKNLIADDAGRLSGNRFVATPRYSPPEFVWRSEVESKECWRAITFYQIGGVLHDMIMRKRLFNERDEPPARLYDAIKLHTPLIEADDCDPRLVRLTKCCLLKDWRERLRFIPAWETFSEPSGDPDDIIQKQVEIRLRQVRIGEMEIEKQASHNRSDGDQRIRVLWDLQDGVFLDTRRFLSGTQIFPRFSANHRSPNSLRHTITFELEESAELGFNCRLKIEISLEVESQSNESTELNVRILKQDNEIVFEAKWIEYLTVESASSKIQKALLNVAENLIPQELP